MLSASNLTILTFSHGLNRNVSLYIFAKMMMYHLWHIWDMAYKKRFICHKTLVFVDDKDQPVLSWRLSVVVCHRAVSRILSQAIFFSFQIINIKAYREYSSKLDDIK